MKIQSGKTSTLDTQKDTQEIRCFPESPNKPKSMTITIRIVPPILFLSFLASAFFLSSYLVRLISPVRPFSKMTKHISFFSTSDYHRKITTNSHERQRYVLQKVKRWWAEARKRGGCDAIWISVKKTLTILKGSNYTKINWMFTKNNTYTKQGKWTCKVAKPQLWILKKDTQK